MTLNAGKSPSTSKPPYRVPTMEEIRALPHNGFDVVSTFAGGGGSSTGYRMAGYRVLWANEFVDAARDVYALNKAPHTIVDGRDIRNVTADDILTAIGRKRGEVDIFDGSPPCASFSTSGKREKGWGTIKGYSDTKQRSDDLFFEFARLLDGLQPRAFVAENVSGLVKGKAKGYFLEILAALQSCGYRVAARLLDAQWLGVPQARQRLIFVGVRNDLGLAPVHPAPLAYRYTLREALPWVLREKRGGSPNNWQASDRPTSTIVASGGSLSPTAYLSGGTYVEAFKVPPEADITKFAIGVEWRDLKQGEKSDRYFNLRRSSFSLPAATVTASGGCTSAAAITHPTECRKFTIPELKRICGFPDDFALLGSFEQQWERLGRAVPPVMMSHIAATLRDKVLLRVRS